jgi:acyl-CoA thioesterase
MPEVPPVGDVEPWEKYLPGGEPPFPFWRNFDIRPVSPNPWGWGQARGAEVVELGRLRVRPGLEDPFVDAGRMLVVADAAMFPSATLAHEALFPYIAPSLDLAMSFHAAQAGSDWLLIEARSPLSHYALVAGQASVVWRMQLDHLVSWPERAQSVACQPRSLPS